MGTWVHGEDVANFIAGIIRDDLETSMGLATISLGQLQQVAGSLSVGDDLPAVFVSIQEDSPVNAAHVGQDLITTYPVRVVYVRQFADLEKIEETKMTAIETIANKLMDKRDNILGRAASDNLTLTGGEGTNARLSSVEYNAAEMAELEDLQKSLVAAACTYLVEVLLRGS